MKAVSILLGGCWVALPGSMGEAPERYFVLGQKPQSLRYDNGQLCTFRRKTKGQNNER